MKKNLITMLIASILVISSVAFGVTVIFGATTEPDCVGGIRVTKYNDLNMNEWWDRPNENSLEGWTIYLYESINDEWVYLDEQVTDGNGEVYWHDLSPGMYMLEENMQDDWMSTTGETKVVQVVKDQYACHNFGNIQTGSICTYKFHDINMDGIKNNGDTPIVNWEFELWRDGQIWAIGKTNEKGKVCFNDVPIGEYTVKEELPGGWKNTTAMEFDGVVEHGEVRKVGPFGNIQLGSIRVCKFYDEDMDGYWEEEDPIEDWEILVYDETGTELLYRGFTSCNGCVVFEDLLPVTYVVTEVIPDGWYNTTEDEFIVDVEPGEETEVHFGNVEYGSITIYKFNDLNMDGQWDELNEPLVDGVPFSAGTGMEGFSGDGGTGMLIFDNILPGSYTVLEDLPEGWMATTPIEQTFDLSPGDDVELYFGNVEYGNITVCKFYDENMNGEYDEGEEMLEGWDFNLYTMGEGQPGEREPLDTVMMIDTSSSMAGPRMINAKAAAIAFMNNLHEDDRLAVYTFDGTESSYLRQGYTYMTSGNKASTESLINGLTASGGTPIWDSIGESIEYSQDPGNQREDVIEMVLILSDGGDYYYQPEAGSETYAAGSEPGTSYSTHTWGHPDGLKWGDTPIQFKDQGGTNNDIYTYEYGWVDLPEDGEYRTGLLYAPIPVYTVGLGITPHEEDPENPTIGDDYHFTNEYNLWQIAETSDASYFYDPEGGDLEEIFEEIFDEAVGEKELVASGTTGPCGCLTFENITPGEYIVEEVLQEGWTATTPIEQTVEVTAGETIEAWFGNVQYGDLKVYKYYDENVNGEYDDGEELLEDWEFNLWETEDGEPTDIIETNMTNEEGYTMFWNVESGLYAVEEVVQDPWCPTTEVIQFVEIVPGQTVELWFGNVEPGDIYGMKYKDIYADGEFDVGIDEPLMGWEINLWTSVDEAPGEIISTTYTDRCGMYYFEDVCPGWYYVQEVIPDGWYNVTPALELVYVGPRDEVRVDFANCMYKYIYGIKYYDYNMNGEYDEDTDWVLPGWEIQLYDETGTTMIDRTFTEECGYYWFEGLDVGTYIVREVMQDGWFNTTPMEYEISMHCCSPCIPVNFGNAEYAEITIYKFSDLNMDGTWDELNEPLIDGVPFSAGTGMEGFSGDSGTGMLTFDSVIPGFYTVVEDLPEGWIATTPLEQSFDINTGEHVELYFGNVEYGNITVCKFYDQDMNGGYDEGEEMLEGWTFNLWNTTDGSPDTIIDTGVTGECGCYTFEDLTPGLYAIQEIEQECWFPTTDMIQYIELTAGENSEVWFGNVEGGSIWGYKYCDANMNQEFDDNECGLEEWQINLWSVNETTGLPEEILETTMTNGDGYYEFMCVEPDEYYIEEILQEGWYNSTPALVMLDVLPGTGYQVDFGNYRHGDIYGLKFCDFNMNGEFEIGIDSPLCGWEVQLWSADEYGNPIAILETTYTDNWGMYRFEDLEPGDYVVAEVLKECGWINTTDMQVHVKLGCVEEVEVNFGNYKPSDITVFIYDSGMDEPVSGVVVELWEADEHGAKVGDGPLQTGTTGDHGYYIFCKLDPGYYIIETEDHSEFVTLRCCSEYVEFEYYHGDPMNGNVVATYGKFD